jgi:hypothetical protein
MSSSSKNLATDSAFSTRTSGWWFEEFRNQSITDSNETGKQSNYIYNDVEMNRSINNNAVMINNQRYPAVSKLRKGSCEPCSCCLCFFCFFVLLAIGFVIYVLINTKIIKI